MVRPVNAFAAWSDYFIAQAGAAGALTGLIFVALSFNFDQVLKDEVWLDRAGTGLVMLAQPIIVALICLWPSRTGAVPAWVLVGVSILVLLNRGQIVLRRPSRKAPGATAGSLLVRLVVTTAESALTLIGALLVGLGQPDGVYAIVVGALYGLAVGLYLAWVLLVEIRRPASRF
jgi:hypothetical protein